MEKWQINRAGVINFWYYDDEEFEFEDGRLLLRGSNGSGKSVTMQSLVPLLFDGNKSPERLDPFGSRARKMDSYLLSDGLDLEERTGYLYLEFVKPDTGRYVSIGMGMRARKNMQMQTWYFILQDNRRFGKQYDLSLYKEIGDKIPLTQKELENRIDTGGKVFTRQKDYKAAVNELLFGYSDITDFEELIELLIQIRSPKLSKEFKPTTMYEIMRNSLITLTEDDLRPMSEAIENMDEIKIKIEVLENAIRALKRIDVTYQKYNQFMLANKAKYYVEGHKKEQAAIKNHRVLLTERDENNSRVKALENEINDNRIEEEGLRQKEESLKEHDLSKLAGEKVSLKEKVEQESEQLTKKQKQLETLEERERDSRDEKQQKQEVLELIEVDLKTLIDTLDEYADNILFDEHSFMIDEFRKETGEPYNFTYHRQQLLKYKNDIHKGLKLLRELENMSHTYEDERKKLDEIVREKEQFQRILNELTKQFEEIKGEYAEKVFAWEKGNDVLKIEQSVLTTVVDLVYQYGENYYFSQIVEPLTRAYEGIRNTINQEKSKISGLKELKEKEMTLSLEKRHELEQQKEPEPQREDEVIKNRTRLAHNNIPYLPLYKALDYQDDIDENVKGVLEEGLVALGILDALIVMPEYKTQVLEMDQGMADKYIFANPELLSHNLSHYLKPDKKSEGISLAIIDDVLKSIFLNSSTSGFYISEDGEYGMGIVRGKTSGTYQSKFIGYQSRKRYKEQLIEGIKEEIRGIEGEINGLKEQIETQNNLLMKAEVEWERLPVHEDLEEAFRSEKSQREKVDLAEQNEKEARRLVEKIYKGLKVLQLKVAEETKGIQLPKKSEVYEEAYEELEQYQNEFQELMSNDQKRWHNRELLKGIEERVEQIESDLDHARYDIGKLEKGIVSAKHRLAEIEKQLALSDYQEILNELESCRNRLKELPQEYKEKVDERSKLNAAVDKIEANILENEAVQKQCAILREIYKKAFEKELLLSYVITRDEEVNLLGQAKEMMKLYGDYFEDKKSIFDYREELNEKFLKETGELVEYNVKRIDLFAEDAEATLTDYNHEGLSQIKRIDLVARMQGREVKFYELLTMIGHQIDENGALLNEQDRLLFEDVLINTVGRQISSKIYHSEQWVKKIDDLMNGMDTSSGLNFNLRWVTKQAETEEEMSTKELVNILKGEQGLLSDEQREKLIKHFRSKIQASKNMMEDEHDRRSFLTIMKEVLDYRKWFEFKLYYTKKGDKKKEMTNNAFFTFSGGEKAMAMYVPLFSAVYAKYQGGNSDCPKVISLDEAFAGVDEKNIQDMFRLLVELDLSFIANSQVLFGDYETVPDLGIYELIRPENVTYVTLIHYKWNGKVRQLMVGDIDEEIS